MSVSATRVITYAEVVGFLESLEKRISQTCGFQWRELDRGDLALWFQAPSGEVDQVTLRQELADEFRAHEGIRCAILDTIADGTQRSIAGLERSISVFRLEMAKQARSA